MATAAKIFFPFLLLNTLLTAKETDCNLILRSLQEYCAQVEDAPRREALEFQLAKLQSAIEQCRLSANKSLQVSAFSLFSLHHEISLLFNSHVPFGDIRNNSLLCQNKTYRQQKIHLQNGVRAVTLPAYHF